MVTVKKMQEMNCSLSIVLQEPGAPDTRAPAEDPLSLYGQQANSA